MQLNKVIQSKEFKTAALVAAGYFLVVKPILQKVGVLDSAESQANDLKIQSLTEILNPAYYVAQKNAGKFSTTFPTPYTGLEAVTISRAIEDSIGFFGDDESAIIAAIQNIKSKLMASGVSYAFQYEFGKSLYNELKSNLSDGDLVTVANILQNKPAA